MAALVIAAGNNQQQQEQRSLHRDKREDVEQLSLPGRESSVKPEAVRVEGKRGGQTVQEEGEDVGGQLPWACGDV